MDKKQSAFIAIILLLLPATGLLAEEAAGDDAARNQSAQQGEFFETHIRPLLVKHCISCHGEKKQHAELRLDSREGMLIGGESGAAIDPFHPEESLLIEAVNRESFEMPPEEELSAKQIAILTTWIKQGAVWPKSKAEQSDQSAQNFREHWAFQPITSPEPPAVENDGWPQNDIDDFILARLENKGLTPSPQADRHTLLRRMTWDLTGLRTSMEAIADYEADQSEEATRSVINRLLASPHYGERWGRHWLDVARYADTKGYVFFEKPSFHNAYTYRDYVIDSLNDDKPFRQFVLEQLAADKLQDQVPRESLAGLGFVTVGPHLKNDFHDIMSDRIDVVTRGFLGLTVGCARCHDHKYDPISTEDYYSFYGIFRNSVEPLHLPFRRGDDIPEDQTETAKEIEKAARDLEAHYDDKFQRVMKQGRERLAEYLSVVQSRRSGPDTALFDIIVDADDLSPQLLLLWQQYLTDAENTGRPLFRPWHLLAKIPKADFAEQAVVELARMGQPERQEQHPINTAVWKRLSEQELKSFDDVVALYVKLLNETEAEWKTLLAEASTASKEIPTSFADPHQEELRQLLYANHSPLQVPYHGFVLLRLFPDRESQELVQKLNKAVDQSRAKASVELAQMLVLEDAEKMIEPRVFERGNPSRPGNFVERRYLRFFSEVSDEPFRNGSGRLELAEAIVSPNNPLTARVIVNRVWQKHFGQGIVPTVSDFGLRSIPPSHPHLLDHLASWFVEHDWSLKQLHRYIMESATYQQRSDSRPEGEMLDPANRLCWRMNRRRLDFETMRDTLLLVAGELDSTVGRPSVGGITTTTNKRRTMYTLIDRQNLPSVFRMFDFPPPDVSSGLRNSTTVPGQALFLMNHPLVLSSAEKLAGEAEKAQTDTEGIRLLYQRVLNREPDSVEIEEMLAFLAADTPPEPIEVTQPSWQYGYGAYNIQRQSLKNFQRLPFWTGQQLQGGPMLPDPSLGWVFLNPEGGHPGNDMDHVVVTRWTAPETMTVSITGLLKHIRPKGNGIRARVLAGGKRVLGPWTLHNRSVPTKIENLTVKKDETIDFVVDVNEKLSFDSFLWAPEIACVSDTSAVANTGAAEQSKEAPPQRWNYTEDFDMPREIRVSSWQSLAQVLLMSNEFQFVD